MKEGTKCPGVLEVWQPLQGYHPSGSSVRNNVRYYQDSDESEESFDSKYSGRSVKIDDTQSERSDRDEERTCRRSMSKDMYSFIELVDLRWNQFGDYRMEKFYGNWIERITHLNRDVSDTHKRDVLHKQMSTSVLLKEK